ncbi:hypothetical protein ABH926_001251 [Catenulispora sp. GP43]|uniref:hypothetical protein n=1 Tax=Catenulispora sp. GP43 TaxID=3156263 RepID=UPI00351646E3
MLDALEPELVQAHRLLLAVVAGGEHPLGGDRHGVEAHGPGGVAQDPHVIQQRERVAVHAQVPDHSGDVARGEAR